MLISIYFVNLIDDTFCSVVRNVPAHLSTNNHLCLSGDVAEKQKSYKQNPDSISCCRGFNYELLTINHQLPTTSKSPPLLLHSTFYSMHSNVLPMHRPVALMQTIVHRILFSNQGWVGLLGGYRFRFG